ncbi:nitroreductase family protein [Bacillus alkalicellulosilyticus]|uniref:nitroreductase family protein n=1 Tax=Alkalihalobacterium alkalicellulosilyticum TaxID=1912214 RepID=UPI0009964FC1|nr:nitroreductase [Bacillus alkalicellulosilyticus]
MDIFEAIKSRRTIGKVKSTVVPKEDIEKILEAGTYAPNHFLTEPWRFFVLEGEARNRLGDVFATIKKEELGDTEENAKKIEAATKNPLRAPVIIAVAVEPSDKKRVILLEEYAAVNAAIQNMLLTAHSLGLGAIWRTGDLCYHPEVKAFFRLSEKGELLAFIYLGYPDMTKSPSKKKNINEVTKWLT